MAKIARVVPEIYALSLGKKNHFPAIRDAAYRKYVGGGPSHGHRQHAQKFSKAQKFGKDRACGSGDILADRQTDRPTDRQTDQQTYILITILATAPAGEVIINKYIIVTCSPDLDLRPIMERRTTSAVTKTARRSLSFDK